MSKYASLLFGADEYHSIGPFRLPIYRDLVPGEARRLEEIGRKTNVSTYKSLQLAKRIAKDKNITVKEAVELLGKADEPEHQDLVMDYVAELEEIEQSQVSPTAQRIAFVTVLLQFRAEIAKDDTWTPVPDWSEEDTEHMPSSMLNALFDFLTWERDGWPEDKAAEGKEQPPESEPPRKPSPNAQPASRRNRLTGTASS